jgi:hypothetical protein
MKIFYENRELGERKRENKSYGKERFYLKQGFVINLFVKRVKRV